MSSKQDRAWADYSERFRREVLPQLLSSACLLSIYSGDGSDFDVQQATELGASLLLGKPLLLITTPGTTLPDGLRRAADVVLEDWRPEEPGSQERLAAALQRITGQGDGGAAR
jgi:hypothetical protein